MGPLAAHDIWAKVEQRPRPTGARPAGPWSSTPLAGLQGRRGNARKGRRGERRGEVGATRGVLGPGGAWLMKGRGSVFCRASGGQGPPRGPRGGGGAALRNSDMPPRPPGPGADGSPALESGDTLGRTASTSTSEGSMDGDGKAGPRAGLIADVFAPGPGIRSFFCFGEKFHRRGGGPRRMRTTPSARDRATASDLLTTEAGVSVAARGSTNQRLHRGCPRHFFFKAIRAFEGLRGGPGGGHPLRGAGDGGRRATTAG